MSNVTNFSMAASLPTKAVFESARHKIEPKSRLNAQALAKSKTNMAAKATTKCTPKNLTKLRSLNTGEILSSTVVIKMDGRNTEVKSLSTGEPAGSSKMSDGNDDKSESVNNAKIFTFSDMELKANPEPVIPAACGSCVEVQGEAPSAGDDESYSVANGRGGKRRLSNTDIT